jgi:hypothetical protein
MSIWISGYRSVFRYFMVFLILSYLGNLYVDLRYNFSLFYMIAHVLNLDANLRRLIYYILQKW